LADDARKKKRIFGALMILLMLLLTATWLAMIAQVVYNKRNILWLPAAAAGDVAEPLISVIIPARNEARDIRIALDSILLQEGVNLEVIAVDDNSSDDTGRIMDEAARGDPRLLVIHHPPLEPGWLGKANAMRAGLEQATGEYILFSDADIFHHPRSFISALREMQHRDYDLISCLPFLKIRLFWEHAMLPMLIAGLTKLVPDKRQQDQNRPEAMASGALILVGRDVLRQIGDLRAIRGNMADDVALAREVKRAGFRTGYRFGPQLMSIELFKDNREAFVSTTKNILLVIEESIWLGPLIPLYTFLLFWLPLFLLVKGLWQQDLLLAGAGFGVYLVQYLSLFVTRGIFSFRPLKALAFPLSAVVVAYCLSRAYVLRLQGKIDWRGRIIRVR
jgi:glycosyltransferase involved in cell wall biosynthesis